MDNLNTPIVSVSPDSCKVDASSEVCVFGVRVNDAGDFDLRIEGSAPLAATLIDGDGVTVSALEDGGGANPLAFEVKLASGVYALHVRAAEKGASATIHVRVTPRN